MNPIKDTKFLLSGERKKVQLRLKLAEHLLDSYLEKPVADGKEDNAFNKQVGRRQIFTDCLKAYAPDLIVETGTHIGESTAYMAKLSGLTIHTCEIDPRYFGFAKLRCKDFDNISFFKGDSQEMLKALKDELKGKRIFFYLDAHFFEDLPLRQEIELISGITDSFLIMIDDFQVPDDSGYGYDDYGKNGTLEIGYIQDLLDKYKMHAFFPKMKSSEETGYKRGSVLIASDKEVKCAEGLESLRVIK